MSTEPTRDEREQLQRAAHAADALANPLITEALQAWQNEITQAWQDSPLRDVEGRERLRLMLQAARQFQAHLQTTLETGQLIKAQTREPGMWDRIKASAARTQASWMG
jgi:hypothetical protein